METKEKQTSVAELKRRLEEAKKKEAERIATIRGTPKELFKFRLEATLTVSKTIEVVAESQAHAEALIDDQINREHEFLGIEIHPQSVAVLVADDLVQRIVQNLTEPRIQSGYPRMLTQGQRGPVKVHHGLRVLLTGTQIHLCSESSMLVIRQLLILLGQL